MAHSFIHSTLFSFTMQRWDGIAIFGPQKKCTHISWAFVSHVSRPFPSSWFFFLCISLTLAEQFFSVVRFTALVLWKMIYGYYSSSGNQTRHIIFLLWNFSVQIDCGCAKNRCNMSANMCVCKTPTIFCFNKRCNRIQVLDFNWMRNTKWLVATAKKMQR